MVVPARRGYGLRTAACRRTEPASDDPPFRVRPSTCGAPSLRLRRRGELHARAVTPSDTSVSGESDELRARGGAGLGQKSREIVPYRLFGQEEPAPYLGVASAFGYELEHLELSSGEAIQTRS